MFLFIFISFFSLLAHTAILEAPKVLIDYQQNPSEIEWRKIDTQHFEIIFPQDVEVKAQKVAHLLEKVYPFVSRSLEVLPPRISIILQNQSTISNAFVTLAPRRSEFMLTPSVDPELTNTEWLKTLAIHEFRHIVQFEKSRQSVNKVFEVFLGEIGQALGIGLTMPPWFLEGDAVGIETALTSGGRGRLPLFERDLRALLLSNKKFIYDKAHLGSFKDYIPNHYIYGYFYTTYLRKKHGDLFLSQLVDRATKRSFNPLSFYNAYRFHTGESFESFYSNTTKDLIKLWQEKLDKIQLTPFEVKNVIHSNDWVNYLYPQKSSDGKILALKKGLSFIPQFVLLEGKEEKTIFYPGAFNQEYPYKLRKNRFAFVEWEYDKRWGVRDYSKIRVFDLSKNKIISEINQTKARIAILDKSGEKILYIDWTPKQGQKIMTRKIDGSRIHDIDFSPERVITSIDWLNDNEIVMVVKDQNDLKEVVQFHLMDKTEIVLLAKTSTNYGTIVVEEGRILLESPESGIDNVFELVSGKVIQLTSSKFGAYAPTLVDNKLIYNDYTAEGMQVVLNEHPFEKDVTTSDSFIPFYESFSLFENKEKLDQELKTPEVYNVEKYSQVKNSLNLHSWFILAPPLSTEVTLMGLSRDVLNKFNLSFGTNYNLNEHVADAFVSAAWSHYYPVFDVKAAFGSRHQVLKLSSGEEDDFWQEATWESGLQIPWKKISGRYMQQFQLRSFAKVIGVTGKNDSTTGELSKGEIFSPGAEILYANTSRLAARDLNPEWGVYFMTKAEEGHDISGLNNAGAILSVDSKFYFPGIVKHHSFYHQLAYEAQNDQTYQYKSLILYPRGSRSFFLDEFRKYSANYLMPLIYPEWTISRYAYFKRLSLNLFFDESIGKQDTYQSYIASTGWELLLDSHFFRIFIPFTVGLRGSYLLTGHQSSHYEVFITTLGGQF